MAAFALIADVSVAVASAFTVAFAAVVDDDGGNDDADDVDVLCSSPTYARHCPGPSPILS